MGRLSGGRGGELTVDVAEKDGISRAVIRIATSGCSRYFSKCQPHEDLKECAKKHVACSS